MAEGSRGHVSGPDAEVQARVDHIVNTYTGLVMQGKEKFAADPFL